ncbi:MAG TPA: cohesin domain-containing protein [Chitinispirillaceae bacterium]|nr:cohesin domain-containing protein [Chitinispirillaceae bacterium]
MNHVKTNCVIFKAFAFVALMTIQAISATISISPTTNDIITGNSIDIDILISALDEDKDLSVFDFNLLFDPSVLQYSSYNLDVNLGDLSKNEAFDASFGLTAPGILNLASFSGLMDLNFQPENFKLATVTFKGISSGISMLNFANLILGDQNGNEMAFTTVKGSVKSVPESSTMVLLGSSISVLIAAYFSKKKVTV